VKRDYLFLMCLLISLAAHMPAYGFMSHAYFPLYQNIMKKVQVYSEPTFVYVSQERQVLRSPVKLILDKIQEFKDASSESQDSSALPINSKGADEVVHENALKQVEEEKSIAEPLDLRPAYPSVENLNLTEKSVRSAFFTYYDILSAQISRYAVYPSIARNSYQEGVAYVTFVLRRNGTLGEVYLRKTSGYSLLDRAAIQAVQSAVPFHRIPAVIKKNELKLNVPIAFKLE